MERRALLPEGSSSELSEAVASMMVSGEVAFHYQELGPTPTGLP